MGAEIVDLTVTVLKTGAVLFLLCGAFLCIVYSASGEISNAGPVPRARRS